MATGEAISSVVLDSSSTPHTKHLDSASIGREDYIASSPDLSSQRLSRYANKADKERKIGHRRVGEGGEITYKKIQTTQIMGSIQLGIQHTVGSLASKPKRDLLMMDFWEIESITFPPEGSTLTPAHHYSEFRYKIYAPIAFRYFRDLFGIQPDDFMMSMCSSPLRELSNPGASGSIFYLTNDDEFIIKTVQHKEGEFLQKLLPGYYMNLNQNPRTLLPKFFGLYCLQTNNSKNIRLVVMNNLLPSYVKMHLKYDLKGSTFKRKASKAERSKKSPTYKDLDFMEHHPNGILLEAETYNALIKTIQRDCTVLESFKIMDYSLLVGVHNLDLSSKEKSSDPKEKSKFSNPIPQAYEYDLEDAPEADQCMAAEGRDRDVAVWNRNRSMNRHRLVAHSTAMESIQAESEPIDDEEDVPPGGIPARSEKGERLLLFVGIIDILQSYRLKKKLEHTFKSIIHDGDTVSVCRPSFYAQRFQSFMAKTVFRKIPSLDLPEIKGNHRKFRTLVSSYIALKHSPSKRKSLSKAIQRSVENDPEYRTTNTSQFAHTSSSHSAKASLHGKPSAINHSTTAGSTSFTGPSYISSNTAPIVKQTSSLGSGVSSNSKVPPPVPPRGSPRTKKTTGINDQRKLEPHRASHSSGTYLTSATEPSLSQNSLQVPETQIPRFGEQRSPSNVRDWLELHDLFDIEEDELKNSKPHIISKPKSGRSIATTGSIRSVRSTNRSETMSHRHFPRVDLFQRQNSLMSRTGRSSMGSIMRSYPPVRPEIVTASNEMPSFAERKQKEKSKQHKYMQYADMALDYNSNADQEENLLQSVTAFIEVKEELERSQRPRPRTIQTIANNYELVENNQVRIEVSPAKKSKRPIGVDKRNQNTPSTFESNTHQLGTTLSCSSTPPPAFDDISEGKSNKTYYSSIGHKPHHQHIDRKMNVGPAFRGPSKEETISVSEIHLDTYLAVDTSCSSQYGSRGGLAWTPPASGEGSTPTWTEGTPSFTDSSSSDDFENFSPINGAKIDRYKPTVEDALSSLTSEMIH